MYDSLIIQSPKRTPQSDQGWDAFFPYYAGYPETFARTLLESANLPKEAVILDPWNGSGTTTYAASQLGLQSSGFDINPVMIIIARARLLPPSEADSIESIALQITKGVRSDQRILRTDDPLLWWFEKSAAAVIRSLEHRIMQQLVGNRTLTPTGTCLGQISGLAATFYVALFAVCRQLAAPYRSSNPTWLRIPKENEPRIVAGRKQILGAFMSALNCMATALAERKQPAEHATARLELADSSLNMLREGSVDFVLTSPPYCTRIDYSVATRIELAVLHSLMKLDMEDLGRQMMGSTRVPKHDIAAQECWGNSCTQFLSALKSHPSKASDGYYYKTHLDYFEKMARSLAQLSNGLRQKGSAVLVVQDSHYKDIHNDLPSITTEMAERTGLKLRRRVDFMQKRSMAGINRHTKNYRQGISAVESVLCFEKI